MDIKTIITIVVYVLFFLALIVGALFGLKRGLVRTSIRLGALLVLLVVAGLITAPISQALLKINISGLTGGEVSTIPEFIRNSLYQQEGIQAAVESMPALDVFISGLPVALMNIVVFFLLIYIMKFISWIVFIIIDKTALKQSKLERQIKKQKKAEKKALKSGSTVQTSNPTIVGKMSKKYRLFGALVGAVQGFILIFLTLLPITSLAGTFTDLANNTLTLDGNPIGTEMVVYADSGEILSETSSDLIKYYVPSEIIDYIGAYSNSIAGKILTVGGLDDALFDTIVSTKVNNQKVALRADIVKAAQIYDKVVLIVEDKNTLGWKDLGFDNVRDVVDLLFETTVFRALAEDALPYAAEYLQTSGALADIEYGDRIAVAINEAVDNLTSTEHKFLPALKNDLDCVVNLAETVFSSGLLDEFLGGEIEVTSIIDIFKADNYEVLDEFVSRIDSETVEILFCHAINISLSSAEESLWEADVDLGQTEFSKVNWTNFKSSAFNLLKSIMEVYSDVETVYGFQNLINDPKTLLNFEAADNADVKNIFTNTGKVLDGLKNMELFKQQTVTPYSTLVDLYSDTELLSPYINIGLASDESFSWETSLSLTGDTFIYAKESGIIDAITSESSDMQDALSMLLVKVSEEEDAVTYANAIIDGLYSNDLVRPSLVYVLNLMFDAISDGLSLAEEDRLTNVTLSQLTADQKTDTVNVIEKLADCFAIFDGGFDPAVLSNEQIGKVGSWLDALRVNAFNIDTTTTPQVIDPTCVVSGNTVTNGGIFANLYITLVDKVFSLNTISYATVNWQSFLTSIKDLSSSLGSVGSLDDIISSINEENAKEVVDSILDAIGVQTDIIGDLATIQDLVSGITPENAEETLGEIATRLDEINDADIDLIAGLLESTGAGNGGQINSEAISEEQAVSARINYLLANGGLTSANMDESLTILCNGATFILDQTVTNGVRITHVGISDEVLIAAIDAKTTDTSVRTLVKQLFNIA